MTLQELKGLYDLAQGATIRAADWRQAAAVFTAAEAEMAAMAKKLNEGTGTGAQQSDAG